MKNTRSSKRAFGWRKTLIRIVTDTSAGLDRAFADEHNIVILPLRILQEDKEYKDTIDIMAPELYKRMREGERFTTAQLPPVELMQALEDLVRAGDDVIFMPLSPGISGTYSNAVLMANEIMEKYPDRKIGVLYTRATTGGLHLEILAARKMIESGLPFDEVMERLAIVTKYTHHYYTVDELSYFYRGGRLTALEAAAGAVLNVKPILSMDEEGRLNAIGKVRGKHKAIQKLASLLGETATDPQDLQTTKIFILHADVKEAAEELRDLVEEKYGATDIEIGILPAIIGVHTGPTLLSIYYLDETAIQEALEKR